MSFDYRYIFFSNILLTFWQANVRKTIKITPFLLVLCKKSKKQTEIFSTY